MKHIQFFESFNESLSSLKSLQKELKEMNRKKESLIKHGKGLPSPGAYASKNKLEIEKVDKEIKNIETKIKQLSIDK